MEGIEPILVAEVLKDVNNLKNKGALDANWLSRKIIE